MESILLNIIESMTDHLQQSETECINIQSIKRFKETTCIYCNKLKTSSEIQFREITLDYIKSLNKLNEKCNFQLIKGEHREMIISMIDILADNYDYKFNNDFTKPYRAW